MMKTSQVDALNDLGLHAEALEAVKHELEVCEDRHTLWRAVTTALRNKRYDLAAEYADRLKTIPDLGKSHLQIISLAYNFVGRSHEAYQFCLEGRKGPLDLYSLACRETVIGCNGEAFHNILRALPTLLYSDPDTLRKAFLDSELAAAWEHGATEEPDIEKALKHFYPLWRSVVQANESVEPERSVDHADLAHIPEEFHHLLKSSCACTFQSIPLTAARDPDLHGRYLEWQAQTAAPRLAVYASYMEKAEKILSDSQGDFAKFQASKGRFGAARNHLLRILRTAPDCNPARLPDIPQLAPLLSEFHAQFNESPEVFKSLIHCRQGGLSLEEMKALPPINRASGTAALLLGNGLYANQRHKKAVQAWLNCARIWPWDETPLFNLVLVCIETERAAEATKVLDAITPEALPEGIRAKLKRNIEEEEWIEKITTGFQDWPLPEFGDFYPGANEEFLETLHEFPPIQNVEDQIPSLQSTEKSHA